MPVITDLLRGLQQVRQLRQVGVRVAVVDQRVEKFCRLPHPHLALAETEVLVPFLADKVERLFPVVESVKLAHRRAGLRLVVAKLFLGLFRIGADERLLVRRFRVPLLHKIVPFLQIAANG